MVAPSGVVAHPALSHRHGAADRHGRARGLAVRAHSAAIRDPPACRNGRSRAANTTWPCRRAAAPAATERHYFPLGSLTGTCGEVLATRVLPSGPEWLLRVSRRRKNFSASMGVASFGGASSMGLAGWPENSINYMRARDAACANHVRASGAGFAGFASRHAAAPLACLA